MTFPLTNHSRASGFHLLERNSEKGERERERERMLFEK
jgi:hypothetical protein